MIDLAAARVVAAGTLTDHCAITRAGTDGVTLDRDTGLLTRPDDTAVWSGACSVSAPMLTGDNFSTTGEDDRSLDTYVIRVPVTAVAIHPGDVVTVTVVHAHGDPDLAGQQFVVRRAGRRTTEVLRRLVATIAVESDGVPR